MVNFNKIGARLLKKQFISELFREFRFGGDTIGVKLPLDIWNGAKVPNGAVTAKLIEGETNFGQKGFKIVSFFNKDGKLMERHRFDTSSNSIQLTCVSQYNYHILESTTHAGSTNIESWLFQRNTKTYNNGKIVSENSFNVVADNLLTSPVITRSNVTLNKSAGNIWYELEKRNLTEPSYAVKTDRFETEISQFGKNTPPKNIKTIVDYSPLNGYFHPVRTQNIEGLIAKEAETIGKDKYISIRLHTGLNKGEYIKREIFENANISQDVPLEYKVVSSLSLGASATRNGIRVKVLPDTRTIPLSYYQNTIAHESRHKWQFNLIDDYLAGKITDEKMKKLAKELMEAEKNYIPYCQDPKAYYANKLEVDAYAYGDNYEKNFYKCKVNLGSIFNSSKNANWVL